MLQVWPGVSTYLLIVALSLYFQSGWIELANECGAFFSGVRIEPASTDKNLLQALPLSLAVLVVALPIAIVVALLVRTIWRGKEGGNGIEVVKRESSTSKQPEQLFKTLFLIIFLEEVTARWLFLGVLWPLFGNGLPALYVLFFLGNGLWALAHLYNWWDEDPHPTWVLPQFLGGILLTVLYLKHGFLVALLVHFAYDCILWCSMKAQKFDLFDLLHIGIGAVYACVGFFILSQPIDELLLWLGEREELALPGWSFADYFAAVLCLCGVEAVAFGILGYDHVGGPSDDEDSNNTKLQMRGVSALAVLLVVPAFMLFIAAIVVVQSYVVYWIGSYLTNSVPYLAIVVGLLWVGRQKSHSLSAATRVFWGSLPIASVFILTLQVLPFLTGLGFILLAGLSLIPLYGMAQFARLK